MNYRIICNSFYQRFKSAGIFYCITKKVNEMKRLRLITCYVTLVCFCSSCLIHHDGDVSISISESKEAYSMAAHFNKDKTKEIQRYINRRIGRSNNISFVNTEMDAIITLDDETRFYIKLFPGDLKIKFNKVENSYRSYSEIKEMCLGIKAIISEK